MTIKKQDNKFCVFSKDGSRKFGCFDSEDAAKKKLAEVESFKKKEHLFKSQGKGICEIKESEDGLIVKGYVATTHFDGQDIILKETLTKWADEINDGNPRVNKVSVNHDRVPHVAGAGVKGTARVDQFPDGEFGLFAHTKIDKTRDDYNDLAYRIKEQFLDSFSIEYIASDDAEVKDDVRYLGTDTDLYGWTLASQPMNEHAVMIKEFYSHKTQPIQTEEPTMDTKELDARAADLEAKEKVFAEKEAKQKADLEAKETADLKAKTKMEQETKETQVQEEKSFRDEMRETMNKIVESKEPKLNTEDKAQTIKPEFKEYKTIFDNQGKAEQFQVSIDEQFKIAGRTAEALGLIKYGETKTSLVETREYKAVSSGKNGNILQFKGLSIGDNQNAFYVDDTTGVGIAQAELQDVMQPVIFNALNDEVTLYNLLAKDDFSRHGGNQAIFVLRTGRNASAGAYSGNAVNAGRSFREKYATKFKKYSAGFAVDGDLVAANRGSPIGEVLALEIRDATTDLIFAINGDLYTEQGLETVNEIIGLEFITDSAGNTTLYSTTRSAANKLSPDAAGDTYIDGTAGVSKAFLRQMIRQLKTDGSKKSNIILVASDLQNDNVKAIFDSASRTVPQSSRFGFVGMIDWEGVPIFTDIQCPDASIFAVDTFHHRIAMWVPPSVEMLGKRSDSEEGFVKTYFAVYNTAPRRLAQLHSLPTS